MRSLFILCALSLFVLTLGDTDVHPRGCIYVSGKCSRECEEGTHAYAVNCGNKTPEATCDEPHPVHEESSICDFSACYCDPPTVRDTVSNKCVKKEDCPKKE